MADVANTPNLSEIARQKAVQVSTWISIGVNLVLAVLQMVVGWLAFSQALVADGLHTLSDLIADGVVLIAAREASKAADEDHPYGHARFENFATLLLGAILLVVGVGMSLRAAVRLQDPESLVEVHAAALYVALLTLIAKELLFRYMLRVATRLRSSMLVANAWHARSDAASSLVVAVGVAGNLSGWLLLDSLAAAMVGFMIARMGWKFSAEAFADLTDRGLSSSEVADIRSTLEQTAGVVGVHCLRTRKMGDHAVVDAHLLVDPAISVSEGHYIAETARQAVLAHHHVLDVLVHIDPEDDDVSAASQGLPSRETLLLQMASLAGDERMQQSRALLHYLDGKVEVDLLVSPDMKEAELAELAACLASIPERFPHFRDIRLHARQEQ